VISSPIRTGGQAERSEHHLLRYAGFNQRKLCNAMGFVPVPNTLMVELRGVCESSRMENTLYFTGSAGVTPTLATTLAANLVGWWGTSYKPNVSTTFSLTEVYVTDLSTATSFTVSYTTGLPSAGTLGGDQLPANAALCLSFRTANRGRSGRGRNYLFPAVDGSATGSFYVSTYVNAMVAAYQLLIGAGTFTPGLQWVVVSRFSNGNERPTGLTQPVTAVLSVNNNVDSMRRRLPGRGR